MMPSVVLVADGVLRIPGTEGHQDLGIVLYRGLAAESRLYILTTELDAEAMDMWLKRRGLKGHVSIVRQFPGEPREAALARLRHANIAAVFCSDHMDAAVALHDGYTTVLVSRPRYSNPAWRPGTTKDPRPWPHLVDEIEAQERLFEDDARLKENQ